MSINAALTSSGSAGTARINAMALLASSTVP
jgi:hypothetical protein